MNDFKSKSNDSELSIILRRDTKTLDIMDRFEGFGDKSIPYKRLIIKNSRYKKYNEHLKDYILYDLVIERSNGCEYIGDITFSSLKLGKDEKLREYILSEVDEKIIDEFIDTDQVFRFSKPYLLRAQSSINRTGYGWEWNWNSKGDCDVVEGTLYGETTDYYIVGLYIRKESYEDFLLDKKNYKVLQKIILRGL